jgi:hypothetical protein
VFAFLLGAILMALGVLGLFEGCNAHFALPPVLGVVPAFIGWGIVRPIIYAWRHSGNDYVDAPRPLPSVHSPLPPVHSAIPPVHSAIPPVHSPVPTQPEQASRPV